MGKKVASLHLRGENYRLLASMEIIDELASNSPCAFPLSSQANDFSKLSAKQVYSKILSGDFLISPPEKTKSDRATVSKCGGRGMKLLLVRQEDERFY